MKQVQLLVTVRSNNTKAKCIVEKETKIVGKFASKQDAFNYKTKWQKKVL